MTDESVIRAPSSAVERAYVQCLEARQRFIQIGSVASDNDTMDELHADLHSSVMAWYEALHPHIADRPGEVGDYWHEAPLWPTGLATKQAPGCPNCDTVYDDDVHAVGDVCTNCGEKGLVATPVPKTDEDGRQLLEWRVGLKSLEEWYRKTQQRTQTSGTFRPRTKTVEMPRRLKPKVLFRISRYLDRAAEEMGLLADTDEALPLGEM
jgi:hypothetical protein